MIDQAFQRTVFLGTGLLILTLAHGLAAQEKISRFGEYEGYSEERFDEWITESVYVEMRDGTRLAIDFTRPAVDGQAVEEKLPVVWTHSRYHRSPHGLILAQGQSIPEGRYISMVDSEPTLQRLVRHGYVVAAAGVRGSGASFGAYEGLFSPNETRDAYEITQWLARQPWCDGNVGMHGGSYLGITQYMTASTAPPALKAIFPNVAAFDLYETIYPGGVYRDDMVQHWGELTERMDTQWLAPRVLTDEDGSSLTAAIEEHKSNWDVIRGFREASFRDSVANGYSYLSHNAAPQLIRINQAQVPAYHWGGWYDCFAADTVLWYGNYRGPQKMAMGSWPHSQTADPNLMSERLRLRGAEQHRWFDYWLKGIDNGIMDEPPIHFSTLDEPRQREWESLDSWPPAGAEPLTYYLGGPKSGSVASANDGVLTTAQAQASAQDDYAVDDSTTTGSASRWDNAVGAGWMSYPDMTANDEKCLTYTTEPLDEDLRITGHPVVTLFVSVEHPDADFYVLLEEVDETGRSHYVSEGILRVSHRQTRPGPWEQFGLPYQRSFARDQSPLASGEVAKLEFDLQPVSNVFNAGHRIRVAVMCADQDNTEPPPCPNGTAVQVHRGGEMASHIVLPSYPIQEN